MCTKKVAQPQKVKFKAQKVYTFLPVFTLFFTFACKTEYSLHFWAQKCNDAYTFIQKSVTPSTLLNFSFGRGFARACPKNMVCPQKKDLAKAQNGP